MTFRKLVQNYLAILLGILFFVLNQKYELSCKLDMEKVMDKSIDIASISFGFLLAVLALLIQGDSPALTRIKESGKFPQLVILNKRAVLASGLLVVVSLIYLGFNLYGVVADSNSYNYKKLADSFSLSILIYQLSIVFSFLDIFYFIIKQES